MYASIRFRYHQLEGEQVNPEICTEPPPKHRPWKRQAPRRASIACAKVRRIVAPDGWLIGNVTIRSSVVTHVQSSNNNGITQIVNDKLYINQLGCVAHNIQTIATKSNAWKLQDMWIKAMEKTFKLEMMCNTTSATNFKRILFFIYVYKWTSCI